MALRCEHFLICVIQVVARGKVLVLGKLGLEIDMYLDVEGRTDREGSFCIRTEALSEALYTNLAVALLLCEAV